MGPFTLRGRTILVTIHSLPPTSLSCPHKNFHSLEEPRGSKGPDKAQKKKFYPKIVILNNNSSAAKPPPAWSQTVIMWLKIHTYWRIFFFFSSLLHLCFARPSTSSFFFFSTFLFIFASVTKRRERSLLAAGVKSKSRYVGVSRKEVGRRSEFEAKMEVVGV